MFSRAAKSVVKSFGQRNYHSGESSLKNTRALVSVAERSRVPGILTPLAEQTAGKPVLNAATTSEQNGLVASATKKRSLNEKAKHDATSEDIALTSNTVSTEARLAENFYQSSLPQVLELPKSEAAELLDTVWKLPAKVDPSIAGNQLREFQVSDLSNQNLGISKQKTGTWSSIAQSAEILGEIGPGSSNWRSCYSRTNFEEWLPELIEHCGIVDINDAGLHGCDCYFPPSITRKCEKLMIKKRRKRGLKGRGRKSRSKRTGTAVTVLDRQSCSAMVFHDQRPGPNQDIRKRKRRAKRTGDRTRQSKCVSTKGSFLTRGSKLKESKIQINVPPGSRANCSSVNSEKRFFQKSNTARENWTVPPIFSNRKPKLLHNFDSGKKKLKPKFTIGVLNPSAKQISNRVKNTVTKGPSHSQTVLAKSVKSVRANCNLNKKRKARRIRCCSGAPPLKPGGTTSALNKPSHCQLARDTNDEGFGFDVETLSISYTHESSVLEACSSSINESLVDNCSLAPSTAMSRRTNDDGESCGEKSRGPSTETSCCALMVFGEQRLSSVDYTEDRECREEQILESNEATGSQARFQGCAIDCGDFETESRNVVHSLQARVSVENVEKSASITSASFSTMASYMLKNIYGSVNAIEFASGEPKDFDEKSNCKKSKKPLSGIGKSSKALLRCGISKKKKKEKSCGIKIVDSYQKLDSSCLKF